MMRYVTDADKGRGGARLLEALHEAVEIVQGIRNAARMHTFDVRDREDRAVVRHLVDGVQDGLVRILPSRSAAPRAAEASSRRERAALGDFGSYCRITGRRGPYQTKSVSMRSLESQGLVTRTVRDGLVSDWRMIAKGWKVYDA